MPINFMDNTWLELNEYKSNFFKLFLKLWLSYLKRSSKRRLN